MARHPAAFLALLVLLAAGCARLPAAIPEGSGVWRGCLNRNPVTLDPAYVVTLLDSSICALLYNGLVRFDESGRVVPDLARTMPDVSADGLTYTFELRRGVRFHNGRELTAEDVVYSFRRILDPATISRRSWVFEAVEGAVAFNRDERTDLPGVRAEGSHRVVITLAWPLAHFLSLLAMPAGYVVDRNEVERHTDPRDYGFHPVGTGPWVLESWVPGAYLRLRANPDYFEGRPHLDALDYRIIEDGATAVAEFRAGNLHLLRLGPVEHAVFQRDPRWEGFLVGAPDLAVYYLALNCEKEPFDNVLVRQAVNHAIDRQAILEAVLPGRYVLANGSIPPGLDGHDPHLEGYRYDPALARRLLAAAGYPRGFRMEIVQTSSPGVLQITEPIQRMLAEVGVEARLVQLESGAFFATIGDQGNPDCFFVSWWADIPDAENFLYPLFHSRNRGGGGNRARFSDPAVDAILDRARLTLGAAERSELYRDAQRLVFSQAPWVPLYFPINYLACRPEVGGFVACSIANAQKMTGVWLAPPPAAD
ncbi:MAG: ABC transporter substrate-binding protein [bacterium]|nr:ABC transporter substrate-binding protein [bacterium]